MRIEDSQPLVSSVVFTVSILLHLVILLRITLNHLHHLRPVHIFQINYFLGLCLLCISGENQNFIDMIRAEVPIYIKKIKIKGVLESPTMSL